MYYAENVLLRDAITCNAIISIDCSHNHFRARYVRDLTELPVQGLSSIDQSVTFNLSINNFCSGPHTTRSKC